MWPRVTTWYHLNSAISLGNHTITVVFTMALNALLKGHTATIIFMVEAVELGKPGAVEDMDSRYDMAPFKRPYRPLGK